MISILIPIYNGIEFIEESVNSVINQSYTDWELLIGVNGHCENSSVYKTAKKYENITGTGKNPIRVFDFYNLKGKSVTLNEMVKYCNGKYIALLDVDDIWCSDKLSIQTKFLENYDVIGSKCCYFGEINNVIPPIPMHDFSRSYDFKKCNPIINSSALIRKELCYWDSNYDGIEDYELWIRLNKEKAKFYNCPEITVKHRIHKTSAFNSNSDPNINQNVLLKKLLK